MLGALVEKQRTTPDQYPLSLNALRLACNQSTNRDPVVEFDEATIREALERLSRRRWVRLAERGLVARVGRRPGQKEERYAHLFCDASVTEAPVSAPSLEERVARLEAEVEQLKTAVQGPNSGVKPNA